MTIDNENCLTGAGTLGAGGSYEILNPLPVFTPTTLFYTGSDLSGRLSLTAPAGSVSIMGQIFTVSGTPTYRDWVITLPAGGILQVGTYTVTAYSPIPGPYSLGPDHRNWGFLLHPHLFRHSAGQGRGRHRHGEEVLCGGRGDLPFHRHPR